MHDESTHEAQITLDEAMPDEELLYDLADLFKVFSDTTRIKILYSLMTSALPSSTANTCHSIASGPLLRSLSCS